MLPAVTASGPSLRWETTGYVPEADRPDGTVLDSLVEIFGSEQFIHTYSDLLNEQRRAFSSVCLQQSRLKATAHAWRSAISEEVDGNEDISVQWASWHTRSADMMCSVDFAEWLVPDALAHPRAPSTFRDGSLLLPWLSFEDVHLVECAICEDISLHCLSSGRRMTVASDSPLSLIFPVGLQGRELFMDFVSLGFWRPLGCLLLSSITVLSRLICAGFGCLLTLFAGLCISGARAFLLSWSRHELTALA
ncbi:unnamed protein product [Symbiodinium sp. CCMP2456]|nr:unnamed protein product [Symbiodinium sp. CCMP2456]